VEQLHAEVAQFEARSDGSESAVLFGIECVGGRSVAGVERIFGGVERLFPAFESALAEEAFDDGSREARELEELWKRKRAALDGEETL
jgi:hypothetical protein